MARAMVERVATSSSAEGECRPLVMSALYPFEQKVSVSHFIVSRGSVGFGDEDPCKSGDLIAVRVLYFHSIVRLNTPLI